MLRHNVYPALLLGTMGEHILSKKLSFMGQWYDGIHPHDNTVNPARWPSIKWGSVGRKELGNKRKGGKKHEGEGPRGGKTEGKG